MIGGYNFLFSHGLAVDLRNARSDYWHVHIYYACALKFDNAIFFSRLRGIYMHRLGQEYAPFGNPPGCFLLQL